MDPPPPIFTASSSSTAFSFGSQSQPCRRLREISTTMTKREFLCRRVLLVENCSSSITMTSAKNKCSDGMEWCGRRESPDQWFGSLFYDDDDDDNLFRSLIHIYFFVFFMFFILCRQGR
ncbi:hypothetical protein HYC85_006735 [Camellia sinensis]|uniref:Uncharacterized protein n=1 Tax=Camellia sinensis TaxID=4442 RepID=A0A7J7HMC4_CAMSI|nr:hypothetical protein HYC85_006735 [Camellia sinensis]